MRIPAGLMAGSSTAERTPYKGEAQVRPLAGRMDQMKGNGMPRQRQKSDFIIQKVEDGHWVDLVDGPFSSTAEAVKHLRSAKKPGEYRVVAVRFHRQLEVVQIQRAMFADPAVPAEDPLVDEVTPKGRGKGKEA